MLVQDEKVLRERSIEIDPKDRQFITFLQNKLEKEVMRHPTALGLAAPQIGTKKRAFIMLEFDDYGRKRWILYVNPRIVEKSEEMQEVTEGCLSLPGVEVKTKRHMQITLEDDFNEYHTCVLYEMEAAVAQHEIDHLDWLLITALGELVKPTEVQS